MGRKRPASLRAALEAALTENPDDLVSHMAYADHLIEQGDPRGEFIQVQLALEDAGRSAAERRALHNREKALWRKHGRDWLGSLAAFVGSKKKRWRDPVYRYSRGWLAELVIEDALRANLARALAADPTTQLLRRLAVNDIFWNRWGRYSDLEEMELEEADKEDEDNPLELLSHSPYLTNIKVFQIGAHTTFDLSDLDPIQFNIMPEVPSVGSETWDLIAKMKRMEELYLDASTSETETLFGSPALRHLRVLQIYESEEYPLKTLANNTALARLTTLALRPVALYREGQAPLLQLKQARSLFTSAHLPSLTHLRLQQSDLGDAGCEAIARSGILKRLKFLDLARGCMTDEGARILARCPDLRNLEVLDVSHNALTDEGLAVLEATGVAVSCADSHDPDDRSYLYEGDIE